METKSYPNHPELNKDSHSSFYNVVQPMIDWINDQFDTECTIIINKNGATLLDVRTKVITESE